VRKAPSLPAIVVHDETSTSHLSETSLEEESLQPFCGITTDIPIGSFDDVFSVDNIEFSKRGSMFIGGKKANIKALAEAANRRAEEEDARMKAELDAEAEAEAAAAHTRDEPESVQTTADQRPTSPPRLDLPNQPPNSQLLSPREEARPGRDAISSTRLLSADEVMLSQRVRSMYEHGDERAGEWSSIAPSDIVIEEDSECETPPATDTLKVERSRPPTRNLSRSPSFTAGQHESINIIKRQPFEIAGGIEDWQDVEGGGVDRYGFILPKRLESRGSATGSNIPAEASASHRMSSSLQIVPENPRRKRTIRRAPSTANSIHSTHNNTNGRLKRKVSMRSVNPPASIFSYQSNHSTIATQSPLRFATNRLPHNRERRWMDEASDMLTLPPGLEDLAAQEEGGKAAQNMKRKEWSREEKWRKMGKLTKKGSKGAGMHFDFDTKSSKLIERTWKGIPDKWRSSAWWAFLQVSANKHKDSPPAEDLIEMFHDLQLQSSADDVQIDVDVPRTINSHIMFRRRYRGGQRLLFRVLHALSIYLVDTGYVQGMAALAATLLCYYDEEHAFVMLVRLWQLRGLDRLYQSGFDGLLDALGDFENNWLGADVKAKLEELGVTSTSYGTRWYLTLFNYSIPFPAQLRVWDVFMLLGDVSNACDPKTKFKADLDVLHATSAALMDAQREALVDAEFENAMKMLTSWIAVRDEDCLMKVARVEWKQRKKR
ncbi:hypothetical protein K402DRAFT_315324, partial [Aulographum hederae CBS 113979]